MDDLRAENERLKQQIRWMQIAHEARIRALSKLLSEKNDVRPEPQPIRVLTICPN